MRRITLLPLIVAAALSHLAHASSSAEATLQAMGQCRTERSPLARLDCYDKAWNTEGTTNGVVSGGGDIWHLAVSQEAQRTTHDTAFISSNSEGDNPRVVITTPALGRQPPRPILMFSCIDNITRMQVILMSPSNRATTPLTLQTSRGSRDVQWFLRENGHVLEGSRGLQGISEVQQIVGPDTLTLQSSDAAINGLTFSLTGLDAQLKPLRTACHW